MGGITVTTVAGRYTPLIFCDHCKTVIKDPGMAAVAYDMNKSGSQRPYFVHKRDCHRAIDEKIKENGGFPGWEEFSRWLVNLLHNSGLRDGKEKVLTKAIKNAKEWAELGL